MSKRIAGTCYINVDGKPLEIEGSVEFPLTSVTRETLAGVNGPAGYKETAKVPFLNVSAFIRDDFPLDALKGDDMTITAELANGWVYTLEGAYLVGDVTANATDGNVTLNFEGEDDDLQQS